MANQDKEKRLGELEGIVNSGINPETGKKLTDKERATYMQERADLMASVDSKPVEEVEPAKVVVPEGSSLDSTSSSDGGTSEPLQPIEQPTAVEANPETNEGNPPNPAPNQVESVDSTIAQPTQDGKQTIRTTKGPTKTTQTSRIEGDPESEEEAKKAKKAEAGLLRSQAGRLESENNRLAAQNERDTLLMGRQVRDMQREAALEEQRISKAQDSLMRVGEEVRKMKVDPNKFWSDLSTGRKVGAALSILAGGLGRALTGAQENTALKIIDDSIQRDVDSQLANIQNAQAGYEGLTSAVSEMRAMYSDKSAVRTSILASTQRAFGAKLRAQAALMEGTVAGNKLLQLAAGFEADAAENEAKNNRTTIVETQQDSQVTEVEKPLQPLDKGIKDKLPEGLRKEVDQAEERYILMEKLKNQFEDPKVIEGSGALKGKIKSLLMNVGVDLGFGDLDEEEAEKLAETYAVERSTLAQYLRAMSGAATTDIERQFYREFFPGIGKDPELSLALANTLWKTARDAYDRKRTQAINYAGGKPVGEVFPAPAQEQAPIQERKLK